MAAPARPVTTTVLVWAVAVAVTVGTTALLPSATMIVRVVATATKRATTVGRQCLVCELTCQLHRLVLVWAVAMVMVAAVAAEVVEVVAAAVEIAPESPPMMRPRPRLSSVVLLVWAV